MKPQLIFLAGVVICGLAVFQFLSVPTLRQKIGTAENELVVLRQKNAALSEILSEIKTMESNAEVVRTALPVSDDVPALIMQLEQIAKDSGLTVQHLGFEGTTAAPAKGEPASPDEEASRGGVKKTAVTMVATGSYPSLQTLLQNLENASRVVNVTNFRFSSVQKEGEVGLSVTLGLEAFYLAEAESVAPAAPLTLDTSSKEYVELIRKVKALRVYRPEVTE